jgi:hypothetical protein
VDVTSVYRLQGSEDAAVVGLTAAGPIADMDHLVGSARTVWKGSHLVGCRLQVDGPNAAAQFNQVQKNPS